MLRGPGHPHHRSPRRHQRLLNQPTPPGPSLLAEVGHPLQRCQCTTLALASCAGRRCPKQWVGVVVPHVRRRANGLPVEAAGVRGGVSDLYQRAVQQCSQHGDRGTALARLRSRQPACIRTAPERGSIEAFDHAPIVACNTITSNRDLSAPFVCTGLGTERTTPATTRNRRENRRPSPLGRRRLHTRGRAARPGPRVAPRGGPGAFLSSSADEDLVARWRARSGWGSAGVANVPLKRLAWWRVRLPVNTPRRWRTAVRCRTGGRVYR